MPTVFGRTTLFLSSFAPLWVVFALLDTFGEGWPTATCAVLAIASPALLFIYFASLRAKGTRVSATVRRVAPAEAETFAYVATYLVPFAGIGVDDIRGRIAILVFLFVLWALYVMGDLFYLNPMLALSDSASGE